MILLENPHETLAKRTSDLLQLLMDPLDAVN